MKHSKYAYFNGDILPIEKAQVGITSHIFNYGTGAFLGLRAYTGKDDLYLFRPVDHFERLRRSCEMLKIKNCPSSDELLEIVRELIKKENLREDCYVRGAAFLDQGPLGARLHGVESGISVFAMPLSRYHDASKGISACISPWRKTPSNAIPSDGKICGAYVNSAFAKTEAYERGFDEPILLTQDGLISECSATNIFVVKNGSIFTPKLTSDILSGITRNTVFRIVREGLKSNITEADLRPEDLYDADEVFITGTGTEICALTKIEEVHLSAGVSGPITTTIQESYESIVRNKTGNLNEYIKECSKEYCVPVYQNLP